MWFLVFRKISTFPSELHFHRRKPEKTHFYNYISSQIPLYIKIRTSIHSILKTVSSLRRFVHPGCIVQLSTVHFIISSNHNYFTARRLLFFHYLLSSGWGWWTPTPGTVLNSISITGSFTAMDLAIPELPVLFWLPIFYHFIAWYDLPFMSEEPWVWYMINF